MAATLRHPPTMRNKIGLIALNLDGTLLNSKKGLPEVNREALERAAAAGIEIVPTTGRFFGGMPEFIHELPFLHYAITINDAQVYDIRRDAVVYQAEIDHQQALDIMSYLDTLPVIYDCYKNDWGYMTETMQNHVEVFTSLTHYQKMVRELRKPVPELKAYLCEQGGGVQKIQLFTKDFELRTKLLEELELMFDDIAVSSSLSENVEINHVDANKGDALISLAKYMGLSVEATMAFGDGLNDLSMLQSAGIGVAMKNACPEAKAEASYVTSSCDADGVAVGINRFCF